MRHRPANLLPSLLLAVALAAPTASGLTVEQVVAEPEVPTWQEPVTVTVRGESGCTVVVDGAGPGFDAELGAVLLVELALNCLVSLPPQPYEVDAEVGRLAPGTYTVLVVGSVDPVVVLEESTLTVYEPAEAVITPPAEPATDAAPFRIGVAIFEGGNCFSPSLDLVTDDAIVLAWPSGCPVLPPGAGLLEAEVEVGPLPPGDYEIRLFRDEPGSSADPGLALAKSAVHVYDDDLCVPSDTALCLNGDRFRVSAEWRDFRDREGVGHSVPLRDDTGLFWFFHPANMELTVKVLDGCAVNGHHWVFLSSGSNVEYQVRVTDTLHGVTRTYRNELRQIPELAADTTAFGACP